MVLSTMVVCLLNLGGPTSWPLCVVPSYTVPALGWQPGITLDLAGTSGCLCARTSVRASASAGGWGGPGGGSPLVVHRGQFLLFLINNFEEH